MTIKEALDIRDDFFFDQVHTDEEVFVFTEAMEFLIREKTQKLLNEYVQHTAILDSIETYIVEPGLGTKSGATGALLLAQEAYAG